VGRSHARHRLAIVADDVTQVHQALEKKHLSWSTAGNAPAGGRLPLHGAGRAIRGNGPPALRDSANLSQRSG
jgi:hypothetical protein